MIIIYLMGGLGNQLFQYAAARRLSLQHRVPLKFDLHELGPGEYRSYRLHHFHTIGEPATEAEIAPFKGLQEEGNAPPSRGLLQSLRQRLLSNTHPVYYRERRKFFDDPDFGRLSSSTYLYGYFQNEGYFKPVEATIRREFAFVTPPTTQNADMIAQIGTANHAGAAVSVHVRRGDYVFWPENLKIFGVLPPSYYQQAFATIAAGETRPHFFIFSDEMDWAREHLRLDHPHTFVSHNDDAHEYEDLRLMSLCKHHIIANSTFSWWGAWLSNHLGKQVIAPARWRMDATQEAEATLPPEWKRLPILEA